MYVVISLRMAKCKLGLADLYSKLLTSSDCTVKNDETIYVAFMVNLYSVMNPLPATKEM